MNRLAAVCLCLLLCASLSRGAIDSKQIEYSIGGNTFRGYLAWDDSIDGPRPAVIVIHEWWGNDDYSRRRAEQLAQLGYVGFAIDMYGQGRTTQDPQQAGAWAGELRKNPKEAHARLQAALDTLRRQPQVDAGRIAAIGYCFGGTMALNMARWGLPINGVVSFHGDLTAPPGEPQRIAARILVLTGAADAWVPAEMIEKFKREMAASGADFEVIAYPGAEHSFTNPDADKHGMENVRYHAEADKQSWMEMQRFLAELF